MASYIHFALITLIVISLLQTSTFATKKTYIVYMGSHQHGPNPTRHDSELAEQSHYDIVKSVVGSEEKARESVLYSYNNFINGFAATLTDEQAEMLKSNPDVVSVFESRAMKIPELPSNGYSLGLQRDMNV